MLFRSVHHEQNCGIIIHLTDDDRQGIQPSKLCSVLDVYKRQVEKRAPFLKDGGLVLLLRQLIVDILILDGAGVVAGTDTAGKMCIRDRLDRAFKP